MFVDKNEYLKNIFDGIVPHWRLTHTHSSLWVYSWSEEIMKARLYMWLWTLKNSILLPIFSFERLWSNFLLSHKWHFKKVSFLALLCWCACLLSWDLYFLSTSKFSVFIGKHITDLFWHKDLFIYHCRISINT